MLTFPTFYEHVRQLIVCTCLKYNNVMSSQSECFRETFVFGNLQYQGSCENI